MNHKELQFDLALKEEAKAFANTSSALNEAGVSYSTSTCGTIAALIIEEGY